MQSNRKFVGVLLIFCLLATILSGCSGAAKELYGTWYIEADGVRNVLQFYDNESNGDSFIWAVYDVENDETTSVETGAYEVHGDTVKLSYSTGTEVELSFEMDDKMLYLIKDGVTLALQLYVLS